MSRLPTPMAMRAPGFTRAAKFEAPSCLRTSAATSGMRRSGNFWRTSSRRGKVMIPYCNGCAGLRGAPLRFQELGVFARSVQLETEVGGRQRHVRFAFHVALIQRVGVAVVVAEKLLGQRFER